MPAAALLLVDVQNDFLPPTGALAVPDGRDILPTVHALLDDDERWQAVFASQDYHPRGHVSFASRYPGSEPYTSRSVRHPVTGDEISQELWPDHCVQGTSGCEFEAGVWKRIEKRSAKRGPQAVRIIRKGADLDVDAYSAFVLTLAQQRDEGLRLLADSTLAKALVEANVDAIVVAGLALDFCVQQTVADLATVRDQLEKNWQVLVVQEGVRGVDAGQTGAVRERLEKRGVKFVGAGDLPALLEA